MSDKTVGVASILGKSARLMPNPPLPLSALPLLLVPYDSLTQLFGSAEETISQTLPATALFSLVYLTLRGPNLSLTPNARRIAGLLAASFCAMATATAVHLTLESATTSALSDELRPTAALRQSVSFALGLSTLVMFQDALARLGMMRAMRWLLIGMLPVLLVVLGQALGGVYRVQGVSSEPSYLADQIVFVVLPALAWAGLSRWGRRGALVLALALLLATFSSTGLMKFAVLLISANAVRGHLTRGVMGVAAAATATYLLLSLWSENYVFSTFVVLYDNWQTAGKLLSITFVDRYMGLIGPLGMLAHPISWAGLGFGADSVYFDQMFDPDVADAIRQIKHVIPAINSLQGKVLLYGGLPGYALYAAAWWVAWRSTPAAHPARYVIPTIYLTSMFTLAQFFLPHTWLWLAFGSLSLPQATSASHIKVGGPVVDSRSSR